MSQGKNHKIHPQFSNKSIGNTNRGTSRYKCSVR